MATFSFGNLSAETNIFDNLVFRYYIYAVDLKIMRTAESNSVEIALKSGERVLVKMEVTSAFNTNGLILHEHTDKKFEKN